MLPTTPAEPGGRPHGRTGRVKEGCGCATCRQDASSYGRQRVKLRLLGVPALVDAEPVRRHVLDLMRAGQMGRRRIARLSGVPEGTILHLVAPVGGQRTTRRVRPDTARRLLAVRSGSGLVDATGARRRLQALAAMGWPQRTLAERTGIDPGHLAHLVLGDTPRIGAELNAAVTKVYDELCMTPGPSDRARQHAARRGYAPPLAWDEDTIDDPDAGPDLGHDHDGTVDELAVDLAMAGQVGWSRLGAAERELVVDRLRKTGLSDKATAARLGVVPSTVSRLGRRR